MKQTWVGNFSKGTAVPLLIPASVRREWKMNRLGAREIAKREAAVRNCQGYEFEWGQVVEEMADGQTQASDPNAIAGSWHFMLTKLHDQFLDAGGDIVELSDLALCFLERRRDEASIELTPEERQEVFPDYISFDEGNDISVFEIIVLRFADLKRAREWVGSLFIPGILPILMSELRAENRDASLPEEN